MRCSSCNHLIVAGGFHTADGIYCGNRCLQAYLRSQERLSAAAGDEPQPLFTLKEAVIYGLLLGICGNFAINDLARRQAPTEPSDDATLALQAQKNRAMDLVRGPDSERLLAYYSDLAHQGHRLADFAWSAAPSGRGSYRVQVRFTVDGSYRTLSWRVNLSERTATPEDAATSDLTPSSVS